MKRQKVRGAEVWPEWRRLLWLRQPYPDNFTDPRFLTTLQEITAGQLRSQEFSRYLDVVLDFLTFHHRLANTLLIYVVFTLLYRYHYSPIALAALTTLCASLSFRVLEHLKSSMIVTFTMLTLAPVLKTLSRTTSSDSIWNLSCWLTIIYVLSYSWTQSSLVPTNILLSNVTVLASRLNTTPEVFCFLLICIELNILLPSYERNLRLQGRYATYGCIVMFTHAIVYTFVTMTLGWTYTAPLLVLSVAFIFIAPGYFIYWQRHHYKGHEVLATWDAKKPIFD
ncbi:FAEL247Wp [Eremothecium gossypii FDAG1]|nr:FAEL247Wp [Eremothecium gossypii FDAG1]